MTQEPETTTVRFIRVNGEIWELPEFPKMWVNRITRFYRGFWNENLFEHIKDSNPPTFQEIEWGREVTSVGEEDQGPTNLIQKGNWKLWVDGNKPAPEGFLTAARTNYEIQCAFRRYGYPTQVSVSEAMKEQFIDWHRNHSNFDDCPEVVASACKKLSRFGSFGQASQLAASSRLGLPLRN